LTSGGRAEEVSERYPVVVAVDDGAVVDAVEAAVGEYACGRQVADIEDEVAQNDRRHCHSPVWSSLE
jgi:hypothetical protein